MSDETVSDEDVDEIAAEVEADGKGVKYHRLTTAEWEQAKSLWELGAVTLKDLSDRFGVARETFSRRFKSEGIVKGSRKEEVAEIADESAKEEISETAKRVRETKEQHYEWNAVLSKMTMNVLVKAAKNELPPGAVTGDLKALRIAAQTLQVTRNERWQILGLDKSDLDPDELPELMISILTDDQIKEIQEQARADSPYLHGDPEDLAVIVEGEE